MSSHAFPPPLRALLACALLCVPAPALRAPAEDALELAVDRHLEALIVLGRSPDETGIAPYLDAHGSPALRGAERREHALAVLGDVRDLWRRAGGIRIHPLERGGDRPSVLVELEDEQGWWEVRLAFQAVAPHALEELELVRGAPREEVPALTWDAYERAIEEAAAEGFSGTVLVVRDGEVVLERGYGFADAEGRVPCTPDTLFAIGSTPIDFTKAAILLLDDLGLLSTSDPITRFLDDVPEDKRGMTIAHLMTGASGLPNFHDVEGVDTNKDLSPLGRDEALERMLGQELLFPPGSGRAHSHSAWGLLAAIVELVTDQDYDAFLREAFFEPMGMERTGLYQWIERFPREEVAVGRVPSRDAFGTDPHDWGPTSWLVMGSGGMVSTPGDLYRWQEGLRSGEYLSEEALARYWSPGQALEGGNDRGFVTIYTEGPDELAILCSNSHTQGGDLASRLGIGLVRMTLR